MSTGLVITSCTVAIGLTALGDWIMSMSSELITMTGMDAVLGSDS